MNLERLVSVIAMEGELVPEQRLVALLECCDAFEGVSVTHRCLVLERQLVVLLEGCEAFEWVLGFHRPLRRRCLVRGVLCWRYLPMLDQMLAMTGRKRWFLC